VADQVELGTGKICKRRVLAFEFLHVVLAEMPQAEIECLDRHRSGEFFGDRDERDVGTPASRTFDRVMDAFLDLIQAFAKHSASRSITAAAAAPNSWPAFSMATMWFRAGMAVSAAVISSIEPKGSRVP